MRVALIVGGFLLWIGVLPASASASPPRLMVRYWPNRLSSVMHIWSTERERVDAILTTMRRLPRVAADEPLLCLSRGGYLRVTSQGSPAFLITDDQACALVTVGIQGYRDRAGAVWHLILATRP